MKTATLMSGCELERLKAKFDPPQTTTEALILHGVNAEIELRKIGLLTPKDLDSLPELDEEHKDEDENEELVSDMVEECLE